MVGSIRRGRRLLLATVCLLCASAGSLGAQGSVAADRAALEALHAAAGGDDWTHSTGWLSSAPVGEWYGVETDANGRVTVISLAHNELAGSLPAELGDLDQLQELWLTRNDLTGEIPARLGDLAVLEVLALADNGLSGSIPAEVGNLTLLEQLNLNDNSLGGSIPAELGALSALVDLTLDDNSLSGPIPADLGSLSSLSWLNLARNRLTGPAPDELAGLTALKALYLNGNPGLNGLVPAGLAFLDGLAVADIRSTGMCARTDAEFSAWAARIDFRGCGDPAPPPEPPGPGGGGGGPAPPPPDDEEDEEEEEPQPPPPPPPPELSVSPAEASERAGVVTFDVRLSRSTNSEVTVDYATADGAGRGGARAGVDYTATAGTLSFAPGSRTEEIRVPVTDDGRYEAEPETFTLTLSRPRSARLAGGGSTLRVTGTIHDDDDGPPMAAFDVAGAACDGDLCRALTGAPVRFNDTSTGKVLSRQWDFGDGRTSRSASLVHSWSSPGFYEVTLSVSDGTTSATASRKFLVEASDPAGTCEPDAQTRCLQDSRYAVSVEWHKGDGESGRGAVVPEGTNDSGLFRFFSRENWEILIKVLDGCAVNGHMWVYAASTTDLGYTIRVTDTVTGGVKEYRNEPGLPAPAITDATAFPRGCDANGPAR
ncbi:MAG: PKD domain-containing protein [Acidobacteria bacterium]|nr:PKD domain-containing protein [Acidobacteriota bacterium]